MSEYQYYEFLAVDRGLTAEEMEELRRISSRAEITPTRFSNEYSWGHLKADTTELLEKYFDIHVYLANWGSRRLALRLPQEAIPMGEVADYRGECLAIRAVDEHVVIDFWSESEDHDDWVEGEGWMDCLAGVRAELLRGDYRSLYLGWLLSMEETAESDEQEPPVPSGLTDLSPSLQALTLFLRIDPYLVAAAAEASAPMDSSQAGMASWIDRLPDDEKSALLLRAARGNHAAVGAELTRRFRAETREATNRPLRSAGELVASADDLREAEARRLEREAARERRQREAAAAAAREKRLDALAPRQASVWRDIEDLVSSKRPKCYDQAIELLVDLRDLAARDGNEAAFLGRIGELEARHARKRSFITRLDGADLPGPERPA